MPSTNDIADLIDLLQTRARDKGDSVAYTFLLDGEAGETRLTYGELDARARDIAARLQGRGASGERVLLLYPPGIDYIAGFFGCLYAGAVAVPVYPPRPDRPLGRFLSILEDAEPMFALATQMVCSIGEGLFGAHRPLRWLATDVLDGAEAHRWARPSLATDALAFLQYTSGSTANPKGVMVSHANLLHNQLLIQQSFGTGASSRVVGWLPLYHDMGLIGNVLHPLYLGTSCVLMSPLEFLRNPLRWLQAIHEHKGTVSGGPNFAYDLCVRKIPPVEREKLDLSWWTVAFNGAEPIRPETLERFSDAFGVSGFRKSAFVPCYGLAEATLLVTGGKPANPVRWFGAPELEQGRAVELADLARSRRALASSGAASWLRIVHPETSKELPEGEVGEIWVCNASVARGYWRKADVSAATFGARTQTHDGPFLRTGDLGFVRDGDLFVVGRIKDLLIIRGRNHYPQDLELTAEKSHPSLRPGCGAAFAVDVDGEERLVLVQEVVAIEGLVADEAIDAIRQAIATEHDIQAHAVVLIAPRSIPKTSSGKIQRRACRDAFIGGELEVVSSRQTVHDPAGAAGSASLESADDVTRWLASRVAACVGDDARKIDLDAPVSHYALDSLQIVELTHDIEKAHGARLPIEAFFGRDSLRDLARRIGDPPVHTDPAAVARPRSGDAPLSEGQRALWFLNQLDPGSPVYNVPNALRVLGGLDVDALRRALEALVRRHAILRTTFPAVAGEPVQHVMDSPELPFAVERVVGGADAVAQRLSEEAFRPFDLGRDHPVRVHVFVVKPDEHVLLLTMHHLVTDFWSQATLLRELATLYAAEKNGVAAVLQPLGSDFQDYVTWQTDLLRGPEGERLARYWLNRLEAPLPILDLPTSKPRPPVQSFRGAAESVILGSELTAGLKRLAREQHVTPFMVLLAAFQTLLHRYTGQNDVVVGTVTAGRTHAATADAVGYFVNPLALRSTPSRRQRFDALLAETKQSVLGAFEHQDHPFTTLVQRLRPARDPSRAPIFQAMFALQKGRGNDGDLLTGFAMNVAGSRLPWAGLVLEAVPLKQRIAQFDLTLTMGEVDGQLHASFDYCTDLFEPPFIRAMADHFENLLRGIVRSPQVTLAELPLLSEADRRTQAVVWNDTGKEFPADATVHEWIERQSRQTPDAIALLSGGSTLTYAELDRRSNQLAHRLVREGVRAETTVGICLERGNDLAVAMLGVMKAGGAFLPLDPQYPLERVIQMLRESRAALLLTEEALSVSTPTTVRSLLIDAIRGELATESSAPLTGRSLPHNVACVIYTSGSTGLPKGVMVEHRSLVNLVASFHESYHPSARDRILPVTSSASISFVGELMPLLCAGGAVVIPSREEMLDETRLEGLIAAGGVTILSTLPSRLASLQHGARSLARIRLVLSGGEALASADLPHLSSTLELVNGYGLTETCACSTYYPVRREDLATGRPVPIGKPIRNTVLYVLDADLQCVPVGCAGELFIAGDGLARGYQNLPAATAERFVPDPFRAGQRMYRTGDQVRWRSDGDLEFLGRLDHQVKIRGHRIELEEIESALRDHPAIKEAVVVARGEGHSERRLVAYVVPAPDGKAPAAGALPAFLRERLPEHMVPAFYVTLEALPLSPNGKVDRAALPEPAGQRPELASAYLEPRGELEQIIAGVWKEALRIEHVGIEDNFFDLGGHSLLLAKVHALLKERLQRDLTLVDLFRFPTVGSLAAHLNQHGVPVVTPEVLAPRHVEGRPDDSIAIIGMGGRFPGATNPDRLWDNLTNGVESITFFTAEELIAAGADPAMVNDPNYVKAGGILENVDQFDASFFGLSPRESELMDPQHRIFLECAWEAVESAGYDSSRYPRRIGVFAGSSMNTYMLMNLLSHMKLVASIDTLQASLGNDKDPLTARVSYKMDLRGPSITIQSASSTSLVAVHVACEALLAGTCEMALAGGVSIHLPEKSGYMYQEGGTTAIDGHCRAFDADATGFVSGKGAGVVLLKRLADAIADGDHIHAVIRGSACNNDGALKVSFTAPSVAGQVDVYRQALASAKVRPEEVGYIECHGTATALGDPIEITALAQAYASETMPPGSVPIGSLKTNIGHLDTAAGVCGLIKAALCVEHGKLVPTLHFKAPNPEIDFERTPFAVNTTLRDWTKSPRIAGVTSLGMGGTNAHVVLAEAPACPPPSPSRRHQLLTLSAKTATALETICQNLADHVEKNPEIPLADVAFVLQCGRRSFKHRRTLVCASRDEAVEALRSTTSPAGLSGTADGGTPAVAFMFPGQGSQYVDMARGLYEDEPVFRREVERACELLVPELGFDLRDRLFLRDGADRDEAAQALRQTAVAQPALFVVEYALARLLMSWGIRPQAMIGHSIGEYVAACLAGVFSLEDAVAVVAARGRLMQQMAPGNMIAVELSADAVQPHLGVGLCVATINHPNSCVVSGPADAVSALQDRLVAAGITGRLLHTSHAFHSSMLDAALPPFIARVKQVKLSAPSIPFLSNLTGTWITDAQASDPSYWASQMRQAVLFAPAVAELLRSASRVCVEVGPGQALASFIHAHPAKKPGHEVVSLMRHPKANDDDQRFLLRGLGKLWNRGVTVDTEGFFVGEHRRRVLLPTYPFERKRFWVDPKPIVKGGEAIADVRQPPADWYFTPVWKMAPVARATRAAESRSTVWVLGENDGLLRGVLDELRKREQEVIVLRPGTKFERVGHDEAEVDSTSVASYQHAFEALPTPSQIVVVSTLHRAESPAADTTLNGSFFGPMALVQAWGRRATNAQLDLVFVSTGVHDVSGTEALDPLQASVLGPCRVIPLEYPGVRCRNIDLPGDVASRRVDPSLASQVASEIVRAGSPAEVALRGGRRWVLSYEKVELAEASDGLKRLREGGVYLLTGGLGGMGFEIAEMLAKTVRAKLVLVARAGLPPRESWASLAKGTDETAARIRRVLELEQRHGAEVEVVTGDVARSEDIRAAIRRARERFGGLHGVIHAAGVPGGGLIQLRERAAVEAVFAGKLRGAMELDAALKGETLDFVVLFSSLTAVVPMPGQVDYVAANAVLDALAHQRAAQGLPWLSIDWDAWRESGMAARLETAAELEKWRGELLRDGLSNSEGVECFGRALGSGLAQVIVSTHPLAARLRADRALGGAPAPSPKGQESASLPRRAPPDASSAPEGELEQRIAAVWQEMLGVAQVGVHDNFFDLGGSSLIGIKIIGRLRADLGVELSEVGLFQAPTVSTLANLIRNAQGSGESADDAQTRGQRRRDKRMRR